MSHAQSKSLSARTRTLSNGTTITDQRHIAGSNGAGITPAVSIAPWQGARAGLGLNYDNVRYDKNHSPGEDAIGFGGTFTFNQILTPDVSFGLSAGVRQPFNYYTAGVEFANVPYVGKWVLGIDGAYTVGKNTLPNTWNIGLSANLALDSRCEAAPLYKDQVHYKDQVRYKDQPVPVKDHLVGYTADPAVYMPQVLAIPDEKKITTEVVEEGCSATLPTLTGVAIPAIFNFLIATTSTSDAAPSFSPSSGLTYSISPSGLLTGGNTLTIDPNTGVITAVNGGSDDSLTATVTATNSCGQSVSTTVLVDISNIS